MGIEQDELGKYWQDAFEASAQDKDNFTYASYLEERYRVSSFVSQSSGGGNSRRPREIVMITDRKTGKAKMVGETPGNGLDVIAQELYEGIVPSDQDCFLILLQAIKILLLRKRK